MIAACPCSHVGVVLPPFSPGGFGEKATCGPPPHRRWRKLKLPSLGFIPDPPGGREFLGINLEQVFQSKIFCNKGWTVELLCSDAQFEVS